MSEFVIKTPVNTLVDLSNNDYFYLIEMSNQTFFESSLYSSENTGFDGSTVNSASVNPRSIKIDLLIKNNVDVESAKRYLLRNLKPKKRHTIIWTREGREVVLEGVFEGLSMPRYTNKVIAQLSFYCENPYWVDKDVTIQRVSDVIPYHYFTTSLADMLYFDYEGEGIIFGEHDAQRTRTYENLGDVETGLTIQIHAVDVVTNPVIYSSPTDFIGINDTLAAGDIVTITTEQGNKDIVKNGVSILNKIRQGSTFLQLQLGETTFTINTDDEKTNNLYFVISYRQRYV